MKHDMFDSYFERALNAPIPIWRPSSSRKIAYDLNVSLQSLANWRVRGTGPDYEAHISGKGNRTFYRPDRVLSWLSDDAKEPWVFCRDWLVKHGLQVEGEMDQAATEWIVENVDDVL